jgi:HEAT repeat protein
MNYEPIPQWTPEQVELALRQGRREDLERAALAAALHGGAPAWAQDVCVRLSEHPEPSVRGNAVLALGHLARLHRRLDQAAVVPVILRALADSALYVRGQAEAAADDIEHFMQWPLR